MTKEEIALSSVVSRFIKAWNSHDMKAFANLFTEDADFVNVIGLWWKGRGDIQKQHELLHATRMNGDRSLAECLTEA